MLFLNRYESSYFRNRVRRKPISKPNDFRKKKAAQ